MCGGLLFESYQLPIFLLLFLVIIVIACLLYIFLFRCLDGRRHRQFFEVIFPLSIMMVLVILTIIFKMILY